MFKIIFIIIAPIILFSYEFTLNSNDIRFIKESKNKQEIINRLYKYQMLKDKIQNYSTEKKLNYVNTYINKIKHKNDINTSGYIDYWATPKEFLINGFGDCEDYAISKYFTLIELGIKKSDLFLSNVNIINNKKSHMVLLYKSKKDNDFLVLDSLSSKIKPLKENKNYIINRIFNEYKFIEFKNKEYVKSNKIKWQNLLKKAYASIE